MPKNIRVQVILYLIFFCNILCSQVPNKIDSLLELSKSATDDATIFNLYKQIYNHKSDIKNKSDIESIVQNCQKYALSSNDALLKIEADAISARYLYSSEKYKESFYAAEEVAKRAKANNMPILQAQLLAIMADVQGLLGNYVKGLKIAQSSLEIKQKNNASEDQIANSYVDIANFHGAVNNLTLSTKYYTKAKEIYLKLGDTFKASKIQLLIGLDKTMAGELDVARNILNECLTNFKKLDNKVHIKSALSKLGSLEQKDGNLELAQKYYDEALEIAKELGDSYGLSIMYQRNAHINVDRKNWNEAIQFAKKAIPISKEIGDLESIEREYEYMYKGYNGLKNYKQAFQYLELYTEVNDSLSNSQKISALNELEAKFQSEKKETEIKLLEEQNRTKDLRLIGLILGIFGLLGVFGFFAFVMKQRIKNKEIEKKRLDQELTYKINELNHKKKELTAYALQIAQKNKILENIKSNVKELSRQESNGKPLQKIVNTISINQNDDQSWEEFRSRFLEVHETFEVNVKTNYPNVTPNEIRFMALMKMNLSSKEIANVLNISTEGIKKARYRLRKKLNLNPKDSLEDLVQSL